MKKIKQLLKVFLILILLTSCSTSNNKDFPKINLEENIDENTKSEKKNRN